MHMLWHKNRSAIFAYHCAIISDLFVLFFVFLELFVDKKKTNFASTFVKNLKIFQIPDSY